MFATDDAIWPLYFAVVNRPVAQSYINWCLHVRDESRYQFSIGSDPRSEDSWTNGTIYILPRETFRPTPGSRELVSEVPVRPRALLRVTQGDFPFRERTLGHGRGDTPRRVAIRNALSRLIRGETPAGAYCLPVGRTQNGASAAVLLAAGSGTRLGQPSKPLARVAGVTLLERAVATVQAAGIERVIVVVGHGRDGVERFVRERGLEVELLVNDGFSAGNASSALVGGREAGERFLLMMVDHVVEPEIVRRLLAAEAPFAIAVDTQPRPMDVDEATKVRLEDGAVVEVARDLPDWDAVDVGIFACDATVVAAAEEATAAGETSWNAVKRAWVGAGRRLEAVDVAGLLWFDIDTPEDVRRAERLLIELSAGKALDGPVARLLNRRLSRPVSRLCLRLGLSPDSLTLASFALACLAAALLAAGARWAPALVAGGILVQVASIVDGCDGEVARAAMRTSAAGAFLDSVLDRAADAAILVGLAVAAGLDRGTGLVLAAALTGALLVPYVKAAYEAAFGEPFPAAAYRLGIGRDVRLLVVAIAAIALQPFWGLVAVAVLANAEALRRLAEGRRLRRLS